MPLVVEDIRLYSVKELSDLLGVTKAAILSYIRTDRLKAQMLGGKWVIASDNLKEFLTGSYRKPAASGGNKRVSLRGVTDGNNLTDQDFQEARKVWELPESL